MKTENPPFIFSIKIPYGRWPRGEQLSMRYYEYLNALSAARNTVDVKGLIKNAQKEIPHTSIDIRE